MVKIDGFLAGLLTKDVHKLRDPRLWLCHVMRLTLVTIQMGIILHGLERRKQRAHH